VAGPCLTSPRRRLDSGHPAARRRAARVVASALESGLRAWHSEIRAHGSRRPRSLRSGAWPQSPRCATRRTHAEAPCHHALSGIPTSSRRREPAPGSRAVALVRAKRWRLQIKLRETARSAGEAEGLPRTVAFRAQSARKSNSARWSLPRAANDQSGAPALSRVLSPRNSSRYVRVSAWSLCSGDS